MNKSVHLKIRDGGYWVHRLALLLALMSFGLIPVHPCVSCEASGAIAGYACVLFLASSVLSFITPNGTPHRFIPMAIAFIAAIANLLFAH